jgi:hypothetical protein
LDFRSTRLYGTLQQGEYEEEIKLNNDTYITIIGTPDNGWKADVEIGSKVCLVKEPTNSHDTESIMVEDLDDEAHVGYVANSVKTVVRGTHSAGRLYDKFDKCLKAEVIFILPHDGGAIAKVITKCR